MRNAFKAIIAASALAATGLAAVQPAQAHNDSGAAIVAGIVGLGIGAAIASDRPHYLRTDYYQNYPQPYYYAQPYGYSGYGYGYDRGYDYGRPDYRRDHWRDDRGHRDYDRGDHGHRDHDDRWGR